MSTLKPAIRILHAVAFGTALAILLPMGASAQNITLPEKLKSAGTIVVGIESTYPPMAYKDPKTNERIGVNIDLVESIARELSVKVKWEEMSFEQLMTSLTTGRIDMIGTAISDLPSRREKLTFVDYLVTGAQPFTTVAKKDTIKSEADLCGKTIGAPRTTNYYPIAQAWSEKNCVAAGKPAATINGTAGATATRLDLKQGRLDAAVLGPEFVAHLMADEPNTYALAGEPLTRTLFGFAFNKGETGLRDAVAAALTAIIKSGAYGKTLQKFGLERQAMNDVKIDAGT
ncbi:ABC transporter substrate-binding protein [Microvirga sp. 17 mud 1-3]|uniref:ABC transporter substrate-binding protein n=1 Tax=Microvirga sp. 17 mud 1-3 TaxID=2082949 RepID=UPI000D6B42C7|nr:ABC transporter substrate-binding protein [Microvirga sp. 17 mud 1-3]AWM87065.1 amino acid ABC transporter substrate-binding protein [Microvirga sp. 17 mud 1-3]